MEDQIKKIIADSYISRAKTCSGEEYNFKCLEEESNILLLKDDINTGIKAIEYKMIGLDLNPNVYESLGDILDEFTNENIVENNKLIKDFRTKWAADETLITEDLINTTIGDILYANGDLKDSVKKLSDDLEYYKNYEIALISGVVFLMVMLILLIVFSTSGRNPYPIYSPYLPPRPYY